MFLIKTEDNLITVGFTSDIFYAPEPDMHGS